MNTAAARPETGDEDGSGAAADAAPAAALALAQEQENARVTLYRCMRTVLRMLEVRGYVITHVGRQAVVPAVEAGSEGLEAESAATITAAVRAAAIALLEPYRSKTRAEAAEEQREVIIQAEVAARPPRYSTAWATALPPGAKLGVVALGHGNVEAVRDVLDQLDAWQTVLVVSRLPLTAYSAKELLLKTPPGKVSQHFKYVDLQAAIVDHGMVPRHAPLNAAMAARIRAQYAGGHFPRLLLTDAMVQFLGMPLGAVISVREVFGREQPVTTYFEVFDVY
jgi:hypothetical protein